MFPDKGISIQNHWWQASGESFTEGERLSLRRPGNKQGAEGVRLLYHPDEDGDDRIPQSF